MYTGNRMEGIAEWVDNVTGAIYHYSPHGVLDDDDDDIIDMYDGEPDNRYVHPDLYAKVFDAISDTISGLLNEDESFEWPVSCNQNESTTIRKETFSGDDISPEFTVDVSFQWGNDSFLSMESSQPPVKDKEAHDSMVEEMLDIIEYAEDNDFLKSWQDEETKHGATWWLIEKELDADNVPSLFNIWVEVQFLYEARSGD